MERAGVEGGSAAEYAVVDDPDASADFNRVAVEIIDLSSNGESHTLADTRLNRLMYRGRVGNISDHRSPSVLFQQFGQNSGPVARSTRAATISQIAQHHRYLV